MTLFNAISSQHPATTIQLTRLIASRVRKEMDEKVKAGAMPQGGPELGRNNFNLKTIAILVSPSSSNVRVSSGLMNII